MSQIGHHSKIEKERDYWAECSVTGFELAWKFLENKDEDFVAESPSAKEAHSTPTISGAARWEIAGQVFHLWPDLSFRLKNVA